MITGTMTAAHPSDSDKEMAPLIETGSRTGGTGVAFGPDNCSLKRDIEAIANFLQAWSLGRGIA